MSLSVQILTHVSDVNSFASATQIEMSAGEARDLYFRFVDTEKRESVYDQTRLRYVPSGVTNAVTVTLQNIDDAKKYVRYGTNPFAGDTSIWKISLLATDLLAGTVSLKVVLAETSDASPPVTVTKTTYVAAAINVLTVGGSC